MKSKDIQKVLKTKYENGDSPAKIYRDLAGLDLFRYPQLNYR